ncbi:MAG: hypothetical protein U0169_15510 [Polyangiaceae bacterium]
MAAPGASTRPRGYVPTIPFLPGTPSAFEGAVADAVSHTRRRSEAPALAAEPAPLTSRRPPRIRELARERLLLFPETPSVTHHSTGRVLVRIGEAKGTDDRSFAARAEVIRAYAGEVSTQILERRVRGKSNGETFGTPASPVVRLEGHADVLLGARPGHALLPFDLEDGVAFFRESVLAGFELRLAFENGKLSADSSDATPMVQLEGTGVVVLELLHPLSSLEVSASKSVHLRKELVLGWTGRLVPRTIPAHEAPGGQHGFVGFGGEGVVLLASR